MNAPDPIAAAIFAESRADLVRDIARAKAAHFADAEVIGHATVAVVIPLRVRHVRSCPVCGNHFTLAGNIEPWDSDTCKESCAWTLEKFAQDNDMTICEAGRSYER